MVIGGVTEVLGFPGAGKSTLIQSVGRLRQTRTVADWNGAIDASHLPTVVQLFFAAPSFAVPAYLAVILRRQVTLTNVRRVMSVQRRHLWLQRNSPTCDHLLDEGPVHALFVTMYGTESTALSHFFLRITLRLLARHVDSYLYIAAPRESCIERFMSPGRTSFRFNDSASEEELATFLHDRCYEEIIAVLGRVAPTKLCIVDSSDQAREVLLRNPEHRP
jgi:hypothetical protein